MEDFIQEDMNQEYQLQLKEQAVVELGIQQQYKNGKNVYNYISGTDAKAKAEILYTKGQNNVISRLCSGYAWNTALKFIETKYPNYATNGIGSNYYGNYADVSFTYTAIDGSTRTKNASNDGTGTIVPTGQTTPVNNIYDMGGNVAEYTTESVTLSNLTKYCTQRGGTSDNTEQEAPAAVHFTCGTDFEGDWLGFRVTLFL